MEPMLTFDLFILDDRYSVATFRVLTVKDEARARELAEKVLQESPHHLGVELFCAGKRVMGLGSIAAADAPRHRRTATF
jgi:hypothetical protein